MVVFGPVGKGGRFPVQYTNNPINVLKMSHTNKNVMESGFVV